MSKSISLALTLFCAYAIVFTLPGCLPAEFIPGTSVSDPMGSTYKDDTTEQAATCKLTLLTEGEGIAWMEPADGVCPKNDIVTLHAEPAEGWRFKCWKTTAENTEVWFQLLWQPAIAVMNRDKTVTAVFVENPPVVAPTISPNGGSFSTSSVDITISSPTPGAVVRYTLDGSDPVETSSLYTGPFSIHSSQTIKAKAFKENMPASGITSAVFTFNPQFTLNISKSGYGTVLTDPNTLTFNSGTSAQVKAVAGTGWRFDHWEGDLTGSTNPANLVMTANKTISAVFLQNPHVATPVFSPGNGTLFIGSLTVTITCPTPNASIYYTLDGTEPTESSTLYTGSSFYITAGTTVKARAFKTGMTPSDIATATYTQGAPGDIRWTFTTGGPIYSSPAIGSDGTIYVGSTDTKIYAITRYGAKKWEFATGGAIVSSPAIGSDGTLYVGSNDTYVYALDPNTGTSKWNRSIGGGIISSPAIGWDGTICIGLIDSSLYALDPNTGNTLWTFVADGSIESSPSIGSDGSVYFGTNNGTVYALYPDGKLKWANSTLGGPVVCSPAVVDNKIIYITAGSSIVALSAVSGKEIASNSLTDIVTSSLIVTTNGDLIAGTADGYLYRLDPNAIPGYSYLAGSPVASTPALGRNNTVYAGMSNGDFTVVTLGQNSFIFQWTNSINGAFHASPVIGSDGTVYVGSDNGKLYAVLAQEPPADSVWPMFRHDSQNTGRVNTYTPPPVIGDPIVSGDVPRMVSTSWNITCEVTPADSIATIQEVFLDLSHLGLERQYLSKLNGNTWQFYSPYFYTLASPGPYTIDIIAIDSHGAMSYRAVNVNVN